LLVVHLRELEYANAEGLGALLDAQAASAGHWLVAHPVGSVPARMKLLFSAWCLEPLFDEFKLEREELALGRKVRQAASFASLVDKEVQLTAKTEG
jgi:hypothetical protein